MKKIVTVLMVLTIGLVGCGIPQEVQDELNQLRSEKEQWADEKVQWREWEMELNQLRFENEQWEEDKKIGIKLITQLNNQLANIPKNPTYQEVIDFLEVDQTDKNEPIAQLYTTLHSSRDLYENAQKAGMRAGLVTLILGPQSTILNFCAFETTDKGIIYILVESDQIVRIEKGEKFYEANNWDNPPVEDTVIDFVTVWN